MKSKNDPILDAMQCKAAGLDYEAARKQLVQLGWGDSEFLTLAMKHGGYEKGTDEQAT